MGLGSGRLLLGQLLCLLPHMLGEVLVFFCNGKSFVVLETCYDAFLVMYDVRHLKWSLNVLIAFSVLLRKYIPGGASWNSISLGLISLWKEGYDSLYSLVYDGLSPLLSRLSCRYFKTRIKSLYDISFMRWIKIRLLSCSYITNRYFFPYLRLQGIYLSSMFLFASFVR